MMRRYTGLGRNAMALLASVALLAPAAGLAEPAGAASGVTFEVDSLADTAHGSCTPGNCTLRDAIIAANATQAQDTIYFSNAIVGSEGYGTIRVDLSVIPSFPKITKPVTIDATTRTSGPLPPGRVVPVPRIELVPTALGVAHTTGLWLAPDATGSEIRGLSIHGFDVGIDATGVDGVTIEGNVIGPLPTGLTARDGAMHLGNRVGVALGGGGLRVQRNLIAGNSAGGEGGVDVLLEEGAKDSFVTGNFIGVDSSSNAWISQVSRPGVFDSEVGIDLVSPLIDNVEIRDNTIGVPGTGIGIRGATHTKIINNHVGVNSANAVLGVGQGVLVQPDLAALPYMGTVIQGNTVSAAARPAIVDLGSLDLLIEGNWIGLPKGSLTDPKGSLPEPDGLYGNSYGIQLGCAPPVQAGTACGSLTRSTTQAIVRNNVVTASAVTGIEVKWAPHALVENNWVGARPPTIAGTTSDIPDTSLLGAATSDVACAVAVMNDEGVRIGRTFTLEGLAGGTMPGASVKDNVIVCNGTGIVLDRAEETKVEGNQIGLEHAQPSNVTSLPVGNTVQGVHVVNGSKHNTIGLGISSTDVTEFAGARSCAKCNSIAMNGSPGSSQGGAGISLASRPDPPGQVPDPAHQVFAPAGEGNTIRGNSIMQNTGPGISLGGCGHKVDGSVECLGIDPPPGASTAVTPNDYGDADGGPNDKLNFPTGVTALRLATDRKLNDKTALAGVYVSGMVKLPAGTTEGWVDVYGLEVSDMHGDGVSRQASPDVQGPAPLAGVSSWGEGRHWVATTRVTTSGSFVVRLPLTTAYPTYTAALTTGAGNTSEFSAFCQTAPGRDGIDADPTNADDDGDGICDDWEMYGLDINGDGRDDLDLDGNGVPEPYQLGADPHRKDIFVEIDTQRTASSAQDTLGPQLGRTELEQVVSAFDGAPVPNVGTANPGINLHLSYGTNPATDQYYLDETNIGNYSLIDTSSFVRPIADDFTYYMFGNDPNNPCDGHFGPAIDRFRKGPHCAEMHDALSLIERYTVMGKAIKYKLSSVNGYNTDAEAISNFASNRIAMGVGYKFLFPFDASVYRNDAAAIFMHELGHSLGLAHESTMSSARNYAPNYLSVMNYLYMSKTDFVSERPLDYSRVGGPGIALDEKALYESQGILGNLTEAERQAVLNPSGNKGWTQIAFAHTGSQCRYVRRVPIAHGTDYSIDWNLDISAIGPADIAQDDCEPSPDDALDPSADWGQLVFSFRHLRSDNWALAQKVDSFEGAAQEPLDLDAIRAPLANSDSDGDGVSDLVDICPDAQNVDQADANHNGIGDKCEGDFPASDVSLRVVPGPKGPLRVGDKVRLTYTVENDGPQTAKSVRVNFGPAVFDNALTDVSTGSLVKQPPGSGTDWVVGNLPDGGSATLNVTFTFAGADTWQAHVTDCRLASDDTKPCVDPDSTPSARDVLGDLVEDDVALVYLAGGSPAGNVPVIAPVDPYGVSVLGANMITPPGSTYFGDGVTRSGDDVVWQAVPGDLAANVTVGLTGDRQRVVPGDNVEFTVDVAATTAPYPVTDARVAVTLPGGLSFDRMTGNTTCGPGVTGECFDPATLTFQIPALNQITSSNLPSTVTVHTVVDAGTPKGFLPVRAQLVAANNATGEGAFDGRTLEVLADVDADGVPDDVDSCPGVVNLKVDVDRDGIDDACDPDVPNQPPVVTSMTGPLGGTGYVDTPLSFTGTGQDPEGSVTLSWDFGDGGTGSGESPMPHAYSQAGTYSVRLVAIDGQGAMSDPSVITVEVKANQAPVITSIGADSLADEAPVLVNFAPQVDDPDGFDDLVSYTWDFGDGSATVAVTAPDSPGTRHLYLDPGSFTVTFTATDSKGHVSTATATIVVTPEATTGVRRFAGKGTTDGAEVPSLLDGLPAKAARFAGYLGSPVASATGDVFFRTGRLDVVWRVDPQGILHLAHQNPGRERVTGAVAADAAGRFYVQTLSQGRNLLVRVDRDAAVIRPQNDPLTPAETEIVELPAWVDLGDLAVDGVGNVYASAPHWDTDSASPPPSDFPVNAVVKIAPDGSVTTVAGNGQTGFSGDGGPAVDATLAPTYPSIRQVAVGPDGSVSFTDGPRIRRVGADGIITTVAGNGDRFTPAGFDPSQVCDECPATDTLVDPVGITVDATGRLYMAESWLGTIRRVDLDGSIHLVGGAYNEPGHSGNGLSPLQARFSPDEVTIHPDGRILVSEGVPSDWSIRAFTVDEPPTVTGLDPTVGGPWGGTSVTITGTNFTDASAVAFGSTAAASFTVDSPTQITAESPPHLPAAVQVTVTTAIGTSATSVADQFRFVPAPNVTAVSPVTGPSAGGTSVTITGTWFAGASAVDFGDVPAASYTVDSANQITAVSPPSVSGTVDVVVTGETGSSFLNSGDQFTFIDTSSGSPPTIGAARPGSQSVIVTFTGGDASATSYTASCASTDGGTAGSATGTVSPIAVGGLTNGTSYTCTVTATSPSGTSPPSDPSNAVTPSAELVSVGDASVVEGGSGTRSLVFPVTLSRASTVPVSVLYVVSAGTASGGSKPGGGVDFKTSSGTVTFTPPAGGETTLVGKVTVPVYGDASDEGDESLKVTLSAPNGGGFGFGRSDATGTIIDDDPGSGLGVGAGDLSVVEGDAGSRSVMVPVTLTGPPNATVTVHYTVTGASWGKTSASGGDYGGTRSGTLTFTGTATAKMLTIPVYGDTTNEGDETVTITLDTPSGLTINRTTGTLTILNDDGGTVTPSAELVSVGDASVVEGGSGTRSLVFPVTLSHASTVPVSVHYVVAGQSATAGTDFKVVSGTVTFTPPAGGETPLVGKVTVPVYGDRTDEGDETFTVTLSAPNGGGFGLGRATGTGTIVDDDPASGLGVGVGDVSVVEGDAGSRNVLVPVTLTGPPNTTVTVHYTITGASWGKSAASGGDYGGTRTGTVTFTGTATAKSLTIPVYGDTTNEGDDTITITLDTPSGVTINRTTGTLTILNDD